jgi:acetolactate synthase-1/2/3 large subunit
MTNQEITTCSINDIPIKIAVMNNNVLGMVRQWQTLFYGQRYSNTDLHSDKVPDFVKLAEAMGAAGIRVTKESEIDEALEKALSINDRPVVIEFQVAKDAMVWPMVAAGASNDDIMIARGMAPQWHEDERDLA